MNLKYPRITLTKDLIVSFFKKVLWAAKNRISSTVRCGFHKSEFLGIIILLFFTKSFAFNNNYITNIKEYYVYQSQNDSCEYYIEKLNIKNDTIYRKSAWVKSLNPITNKNISFFLSDSNSVRIDTLIKINKSKYIFINGNIFIDSLAPFAKTATMDPVWLNNTVFIDTVYNDFANKYIKFSYINAFEADNQYSYTFEINKWISEYDFYSINGQNNIYKLIDNF